MTYSDKTISAIRLFYRDALLSCSESAADSALNTMLLKASTFMYKVQIEAIRYFVSCKLSMGQIPVPISLVSKHIISWVMKHRHLIRILIVLGFKKNGGFEQWLLLHRIKSKNRTKMSFLNQLKTAKQLIRLNLLYLLKFTSKSKGTN